MIDELAFGAPKTQDMAAIFKALGCEGQSLLVTTAELRRECLQERSQY